MLKPSNSMGAPTSPKAEKPVWAKLLALLPCVVVCGAFQLSSTALVGFHQFQRPTWTGFCEGIQ